MSLSLMLAGILIIGLIILVGEANGQNQNKYLNEDKVNMILGYCYLHADRPNPVQDLVDKGLVSTNFADDTCASVKQGSEDAQRVKGHEEFVRQASDSYNQCLQEKTSTDCWDIIDDYCNSPAYAQYLVEDCQRTRGPE
jgi:hypothetical protein